MKSTLTISWDKRPIDPIVIEGFENGLRVAKELGFHGVELNGDAADFDVEKLKRSLVAADLELSSIMTGAINSNGDTLSSADADVRATCETSIRRAIDIASECGGLVSIGLAVGTAKGAERPFLVDALRELSQFACSQKVKLCIEPINRYLGSGIRTVADALAIIAEVSHHNLGITLDTFQANIEETSIPNAIRDAGDRLFHIQLADNTRLAPGSGSMDFAAIRKALLDIGYTGWLSAELMPLPDPIAVATDWMAFYKDYVAMPPTVTLPQLSKFADRLNDDPEFQERAVYSNVTVALTIEGQDWVFWFGDGKIIHVSQGLPLEGVDLRIQGDAAAWDSFFTGSNHLIRALNPHHGCLSVIGNPITLTNNMRPLFYLFSKLNEVSDA